MARRTRRDLSKKAIRKNIKSDLKSSNNHSGKFNYSIYLKPLIFLIGVFLITFIIFRLIDNTDFTEFFNSSESMADTTGMNRPASEIQAIQQPVQSEELIPEEPQITTQPVEHGLQIEVLNGCGEPGIAAKTTDYCRQNGLDVVSMGNYRNFDVTVSRVIGWENNREEALKVAEIMGIKEAQVSLENDPDKQLAASIIIGKDYQKLKPFQN